jgi:RNA polymerase sigma-70 factor (ECF subfamily)
VKEPDATLKEAAVKGDRNAIERLFRDLYPPVYGFCFSMTRRQSDAEDLAQHTFLRAFGSLRSFRPAQPIAPWILRIAHNLFIDQWRNRRREPELEEPALEPLASQEATPEAVALSRETRRELMRALRSLSPAEQVVLVLHYGQQLSYEEIGLVIGKPVTTVTNRLFLARRRLAATWRQSPEGGSDALQLVGS